MTNFAPMGFAMDDPRWTFNALVNAALAGGMSPEEINQGTTRIAQSPKGNDISVTDLNSLGIWGQGAMDPATRQRVNEEVQSLARQSRRDSRTNAAAVAAAAAGGAALSGGFGGGAAGGSGALSPVSLPANAVPISAGGGGAGALSTIGLPANAVPMSTGGGGIMSRIGDFLGGGGSVPNLQGWGSVIGGGLGLLDSFMQPDSQTVTQQTQLPPEIQQALSFLIDQSMGLADSGTLAPGLSDRTMGGIDALGSPLSGPGFDALSGFAGGEFMNPFMGSNDMSGVRDSITAAAKQAVGDRFSQAGRSGSPGEGLSLGRTVARELAPYEFGARENQMQREFGAGENMLDRRLSSALPMMQMQRQQILDQLMGGGLLDEQARREALEPFQRLDLLTGPLVSAISGAPRSSSTTTPLHSNPLLSGLGGALAGSQVAGLFG